MMYNFDPPTLETFSHWPSWLNAYGNLDRSACFELRVSRVRRLAGCVPLMKGKFGRRYRDRNQRSGNMPDLPNERRAIGHKRLISKGHYDITAGELDWLARQEFPRRLAGDWRTGRAPAMRRVVQSQPSGHTRTEGAHKANDTVGQSHPPGRGPAARYGMSLEQGGHGPGERAYERELVCMDRLDVFAQETGGGAGPRPGSLPGQDCAPSS
ncbi:MAG: hypothetical protein AAGI37_15695 [Planctomycetota bacterium]